MRLKSIRSSRIAAALSLLVLIFTSCDDDFYLSEREVAAYNGVLSTEAIANMHLDSLQGRTLELQFSNSSGSPTLSGTNLLSEMRATELSTLETGPGPILLGRLASELEAQIGKWAEDRLELYTSQNSDEKARLTRLNTVRLTFLTNPVFDYRSRSQSIGYSVRTRVEIDGVVEVNAVNWLVNLFANINGSYPMTVTIPDLRLDGEALVYSPVANAGRIRLKMTPSLGSAITVAGNGTSVPGAVQDGLSTVLSHSMTRPVDHIFDLGFYHFSIPDLRITPQSPMGPERLRASYAYRSDWLGPDDARPELHIVAPRTDGNLYHGVRRNGEWSDYGPVGFGKSGKQIDTAKIDHPVLVHSGEGQLELAASDDQGRLVYAHWRDEAWGNEVIIEPVKNAGNLTLARGEPALAATAPGQVEIVVQGSDGELWHHRRVHGEWVTPKTVPLKNYPGFDAPFRDPAVAIVGGKLVVAFVDSQDLAGAIAFDLETRIWGQPTTLKSTRSIRSKVRYAPVLAACGGDKLELAYSNDAGLLIHQRLEVYSGNFEAGVGQTGISFSSPHKFRQFTTNASPELTCSSFGQPELIARDTYNRLQHNLSFHSLAPHPIDGRTVNPGWQGWTILAGGFSNAQPKYPLHVAGFSSAGTRTGKLEVAALSSPQGQAIQSRVFFNEFESGRYGRELWKTVGWRGWDLTDIVQYTGRPAIAAVDRNFQSVHIGNRNGFGLTPHVDRIAATNATYPLGSTIAVRSASNHVDPIVLTAGPGIYDDFIVRADGTPVHTRHRLSGVSRPFTVSVPADTEIKAMAAAGFGNGALMFVATATNRSVFVWRFRGDDWSPALQVGRDAVSAPALVHTGAGDFDLFYLNSGGALIRTQYMNGAWGNPEKIPAGFSANDVLFSSRSVASWGDGTVDLILVRRQDGRLFHRRFFAKENCSVPQNCRPEAFTDIGGTSKEDPVLAAFGPAHLNVLAMRGLKWYSTETSAGPVPPPGRGAPPAPSLLWPDFESIGGSETVVGGISHSGPMNVSAIATATGELYIVRKSNGVWTGFRPIAGQRADTIVRMPIFLPDITSHGGG
ncbi:MAG: hypothetical protein DWQ47_11085 [Acidobacteria bacterium]|nr:MAG: hypothetical protein DWQ32_13500 [Acidobacteriota bacterium]REJ98123.1 MAG: hypothetical protein DWQ38_16300 [Acidobacteriota bacterium]REK16866.1 MAG: hypothetical protein DWQ43_01345 [Acidobacteriota bacterium]REK42777.1 MAG: hypothetical protein DWQ47_11085 [Acidobacteriota bacterium]